jgi:hypothetical protein
MTKQLKTKAKNTAKAGAQGAKTVMAEALGAAAVAAAGVVITRTAEALASGVKQAERAKPAAEAAAYRAVAPPPGRGRKMKAKKKAQSSRKATARAVKAARKRKKARRR